MEKDSNKSVGGGEAQGSTRQKNGVILNKQESTPEGPVLSLKAFETRDGGLGAAVWKFRR